MDRTQIPTRWREHLMDKLQDHYGLSKEDAENKVDGWLNWLPKTGSPYANTDGEP